MQEDNLAFLHPAQILKLEAPIKHDKKYNKDIVKYKENMLQIHKNMYILLLVYSKKRFDYIFYYTKGYSVINIHTLFIQLL